MHHYTQSKTIETPKEVKIMCNACISMLNEAKPVDAFADQ